MGANDGRAADERTDPLGKGNNRRDRDEPQGSGDPQGQVAPSEVYIWPSFNDIEGVLYQLTVQLYGSHDLAGRSFRIENRGAIGTEREFPSMESIVGVVQARHLATPAD